MKHLLIALLLMLSFSTMAQKYSLNASYFIAVEDGRVVDEDEVDIDVTIDIDRERLTIYSNETQIIDFEALRTYTDSDGYFVTEASATDTYWKPIHLRILIPSNSRKSVIIYIVYPNFSYAYLCKPV